MRPSLPLRFAFISVVALLLAACGGAKPETVVERFYRAAAAGDVEKATAQISFAKTPADQMVQAKGKVQVVVGEMQNKVAANDGLDTIEVVSSVINDDAKTATVESKVLFKNGKSTVEKHHLVQEDDGWKITLRW